MKRREFLKYLAALSLLPLLQPDNQLYTFGGWFLTNTPGRYEFQVMTGTADDRDAFFNGHTGHTGRGWFVFMFLGEMTPEDIESFRVLFEEDIYRFYLPVIMK